MPVKINEGTGDTTKATRDTQRHQAKVPDIMGAHQDECNSGPIRGRIVKALLLERLSKHVDRVYYFLVLFPCSRHVRESVRAFSTIIFKPNDRVPRGKEGTPPHRRTWRKYTTG